MECGGCSRRSAHCTSLLLPRHGIPSRLVERHPGTSIHPRARGLNVRTLELLRTWGLADAVRAAGRALEDARYIIWAASFAGPEYRRVEMLTHRAFFDASVSPTSYVACAQNNLELVLLAQARSYRGADHRFGHEFLSFRQEETGVVALVHDRSTGEEISVRADYLVAADGTDDRFRSLASRSGAGRS